MSEDLELKLQRLARKTERIGPVPGFTERVLAAVHTESAQSFGAGVVRFGKAMLAVAAVSAVVGVTVGFASQHAADEALAATSSMEDFDW